MPETFKSLRVEPTVKREFDLLAAAFQRPVYEIAAEAVEAWKAAHNIQNIAVLPRPDDSAQVVPVVSISQ